MKRNLIFAVSLITLLGAPRNGRAQEPPKVTVAVMSFTAAAMVKRDQYEALSAGIPIILGTELVTHPRVKLVERERMEKVMAELQLGATDKVDPATAVKMGKLLNAQYLVLGGFLVDMREDIELTTRVVEVETGQIRSATKVRGKGQDVFDLIGKLTKALSPLLSIDVPPGQPRGGETAHGDEYRGMTIFVEADRQRREGNKERAIQLARNAMQVAPRMEPECRALLAQLGAL